jgi:hypothetical protein
MLTARELWHAAMARAVVKTLYAHPADQSRRRPGTILGFPGAIWERFLVRQRHTGTWDIVQLPGMRHLLLFARIHIIAVEIERASQKAPSDYLSTPGFPNIASHRIPGRTLYKEKTGGKATDTAR